MWWVFLFVCWAWASEVVPGRLAETRGEGAVLELSMRMGTPPRDVRLLADFTHGDIVLPSSPRFNSFSAYVTPVGFEDILHIGNKHLVLPIRVDYQEASRVCPWCDGVIGLGGSSPLWLIWRGVKVTSDGLEVSEKPFKVEDEGSSCLFPRSEFCVTQGSVLGSNTTIYISPNEAQTRLPNALFKKLRGRRRVEDSWPSLHIHLPPNEKIRIPGHHVRRSALGEPEYLTVIHQSSTVSVVTLGYEVLRAGAFVRDFNRGTLHYLPRRHERNSNPFLSIVFGILWTIFVYWKLVKPDYRVTRESLDKWPMMIVMHFTMDIFTVLAPFLIFWQHGVLHFLLHNILFFVMVGLGVGFGVFWMVITIIGQATRGAERLGFFGEMHLPRHMPEFQNDAFRAEYANDELSNLLAPPVRLRVVRAVIVQQYVRDVLIMMSVFLILAGTHGFFLGTFWMVVAYGYLLSSLFSCFLCSLHFLRSQPNIMWFAFLASQAIVSVAIVAYNSVFVLYPWARWFETITHLFPWFTLVAFYLLAALVFFYVLPGHVETFDRYVTRKPRIQ